MRIKIEMLHNITQHRSYVVRWTPCELPCSPYHRTDSSEAWCCRPLPPPLVLYAALSVPTYNSNTMQSHFVTKRVKLFTATKCKSTALKYFKAADALDCGSVVCNSLFLGNGWSSMRQLCNGFTATDPSLAQCSNYSREMGQHSHFFCHTPHSDKISVLAAASALCAVPTLCKIIWSLLQWIATDCIRPKEVERTPNPLNVSFCLLGLSN